MVGRVERSVDRLALEKNGFVKQRMKSNLRVELKMKYFNSGILTSNYH